LTARFEKSLIVVGQYKSLERRLVGSSRNRAERDPGRKMDPTVEPDPDNAGGGKKAMHTTPSTEGVFLFRPHIFNRIPDCKKNPGRRLTCGTPGP